MITTILSILTLFLLFMISVQKSEIENLCTTKLVLTNRIIDLKKELEEYDE